MVAGAVVPTVRAGCPRRLRPCSTKLGRKYRLHCRAGRTPRASGKSRVCCRAVVGVGEFPSSSASHLRILGLGSDASTAEIKKAYRRLALQYHPDITPRAGKESLEDQEARELRFMEVKDAFEVLTGKSAPAEGPAVRDHYRSYPGSPYARSTARASIQDQIHGLKTRAAARARRQRMQRHAHETPGCGRGPHHREDGADASDVRDRTQGQPIGNGTFCVDRRRLEWQLRGLRSRRSR